MFTGRAGAGKSRLAHELSKEKGIPISNSMKNRWFDGYNGTDDILFDDFYGTVPAHLMLNIMDEYACKVEKKGGTVSIRPKNVYITSNRYPHEWYKTTAVAWEALERRIDVHVNFLGRDGNQSLVDVEKADSLDRLRLSQRSDLFAEGGFGESE